jgi:hypothetical protein
MWPIEPAVWRIHAGEVLHLIGQMIRDEADERPLDRAALTRHLGQAITRAQDATATLPEQHLMACFDLSLFEVAVLWLALSPHLDPTLRPWIAKLQGSGLHDFIDGALCLRLLCEDPGDRLAHQDALSAQATLQRRRLLTLRRREVAASYALTHELSPAHHLCGWFLGYRRVSDALAAFTDHVPIPHDPPPPVPWDAQLDARTLPLLNGLWRAPLATSSGVAVALTGDIPSSPLWATRCGRAVLDVNGDRLATATPGDIQRALHLLCQEAAMYGELLLLRGADPLTHPDSSLAPHLAHALALHPAATILCVNDPSKLHPCLSDAALQRLSLSPNPTPAQSKTLWTHHLLRLHLPLDPTDPNDLAAAAIDTTSQQLSLTAPQIARAARLTALLHGPANPLTPALLRRTGQAQITQQMGTLAQRSDASTGFEGLILDPPTERQLREILAAIRSRQLVIRQWGLGERIRRGTGITCLFDGDPGTGKTLSAEVIAAEAGLDLLRVNVSTIVDKYIGETEKNLAQIFEQVRPDVSLLLFDEADSLFSKRTEVTKSTDRYSNMEINVLLQLIERYEGVTVLTTNLKRSIDPAFERRITFKVSFDLPEASSRERIWLHLLPPSIPTAEPLDYEFLGGLELSGGEIKNAILRAAYAAACDDDLIRMRHLVESARREATASGRLIRDDY